MAQPSAMKTKVGPLVEVQKGAKIGRRCKISSHIFICEGVPIEPEIFVRHGMTFINDRYPRATNSAGNLKANVDWNCQTKVAKRGASLLTTCPRP
jgi:UDP-2-acetamido-3-amino-2,3-dideoxy-glucuronate N-acetyltransferase